MTDEKVIFLDIDGVLVTARAFVANRAYKRRRRNREFDSVGAGIIRAACLDCGAKIVISSTWRFNAIMDGTGKGMEGILYNRLKKHKLLEFVHSDWRTVDLYRFSSGVRGDEIKEWLDRHPEVSKYAIIDDDSDMLPEQMDRFVHVKSNDGILFKDWRALKDLLS